MSLIIYITVLWEELIAQIYLVTGIHINGFADANYLIAAQLWLVLTQQVYATGMIKRRDLKNVMKVKCDENIIKILCLRLAALLVNRAWNVNNYLRYYKRKLYRVYLLSDMVKELGNHKEICVLNSLLLALIKRELFLVEMFRMLIRQSLWWPT